jgi:hypothetical protein
MPLSKADAERMTVNERLVAAGTIDAFDEAVHRRDVPGLRRLLAAVYLEEPAVSSIVESVLDPGWAVREETARRFKGGDWQVATDTLQQLALPFLGTPGRALDRARVQMALVKLAAGDAAALHRWARQAETDWRDVLVAAGLAGADWKKVLARGGFAVPGGSSD